MSTFVGEYDRQLDDKGRFVVPAKVREKLGNTVYITRPLLKEKCLHIYTQEAWEVMSEKLSNLPTSTDRTAGEFMRRFYAGVTECDLDKQGRVSVEKRFIEYAELKKDIVLVGANTRLEIWDSDTWRSYQDSLSDDIILESIEKFGLNL